MRYIAFCGLDRAKVFMKMEQSVTGTIALMSYEGDQKASYVITESIYPTVIT